MATTQRRPLLSCFPQFSHFASFIRSLSAMTSAHEQSASFGSHFLENLPTLSLNVSSEITRPVDTCDTRTCMGEDLCWLTGHRRSLRWKLLSISWHHCSLQSSAWRIQNENRLFRMAATCWINAITIKYKLYIKIHKMKDKSTRALTNY